MTLQLLRHATLWLTVNDKFILVDPMFVPQGAYPAFPGTGNGVRNPTVDLPVSTTELAQLLARTDAVLVTHLHADHWDAAAQEMLPKHITILCQPADGDKIWEAGFSNVTAVEGELGWEGITFHRTGGRHGTGEIGVRMGTVSGFVVEHGGHRLYLAGDTIWCDEVTQALDRFQPRQIVVNGGGARFEVGDPIVMDTHDIVKTSRYAPAANVYVVHLETVNHSRENRAATRAAITATGLDGRCFVPEDGESIALP